MRGYRGLGDIPDRMGLTFEEGGAVTDLPYAEGQTLSTLADNWTRVRLEPVILTWGAHVERLPIAGQRVMFTLQPRRVPVRIIHMAAELQTASASTALFYGRITGSGLPGASIVDPILIEGENPLLALGQQPSGQTPDARFLDHGSTAFAALNTLSSPFMHAFFNQFDSTMDHIRAGGNAIIVLPGQIFVWQGLQLATSGGLTVVWQELPSMVDVITAQNVPRSDTAT